MILAGLALVLASPAALAQDSASAHSAVDEACDLAPGTTGTVAEVIDGDTLMLVEGLVVRMAGIEAPKPLSARPGAEVTAIVQAVRRELERRTRGTRIVLHAEDPPIDRHGRTLAQIFQADGSWLQETMVAAGLARVRPFDGCLDSLLARENEAREAGRGLWQEPEFAIISADDPSLLDRKGLYVLVEGRVVSVGRGNHVDFLNFGRYWRRDFTVMVGVPVATRLGERGLPVEALAERRVRVRGVIEENGGPVIRLNQPGEIEVLDDD